MSDPASKPAPSRPKPIRWALRGLAASVPLLLIGLLIYGVTAQSPNASIDDALSRGRTTIAPSFRLAVLQAGSLGTPLEAKLAAAFRKKIVTLSDLRGTPVVLNFWASWCVPCQEEASTLERAWRQQARPRGVLFLGLDMQDVTTDAHSFIRHYAIDYPNIRDPSNDIARAYGVTGVPETFFIGSDGHIVGHIIGASSTARLTAGISAALAGHVEHASRGGEQRPLQ
ncbi:MAG TPA: TlpA disulfide reductase family protein [Solirubrobacteraceae bacterium]|nr:TlpA disulfide reductase family protein [Solirubrobacteraceae bacterium]